MKRRIAARIISATLAILLAAPNLTGCGVSDADKGPELTMEAVYEANTREALLSGGGIYRVESVCSDDEQFRTISIYTDDELYTENGFSAAEDGERSCTLNTGDRTFYLYTDANGEEDFSVDWYAMPEDKISDYNTPPAQSEPLDVFSPFEEIVSAEDMGDGTVVVSTEGGVWGDTEAPAGDSDRTLGRYVVDKDTLRVISGETTVCCADGTQEPTLSFWASYEQQIPDNMRYLQQRSSALGSVQPRLMKVVYDAGSEDEQVYELTADVGTTVYSYILDGYCSRGDPKGATPYYGDDAEGDVTMYAVREKTVDEKLADMTLREKIGQMIMPAFRTWDGGDGAAAVTELPDEIREAIARDRFGGIILFAENCAQNAQVVRLVNEMQEANQNTECDVSVPLLIAVDQEGGNVARLGEGTRLVGNMALAATGDPQNAYDAAKLIGDELFWLNINTDFAPVVDTNDNPANPVIGVRSFSDDPQTAADFGTAFMDGLGEYGIISALKHFPGHGNTSTDSHTGLPKVEKTLEELRACELIPFEAGIENGAEMIMTAHIQYPLIESGTYISVSTGEEINLPATLSRTILTDILREEMGFDGVIVSDALEMGAISGNFAPRDVWRMAIDAGVNLFLMPVTVTDAESLAALENMIDTVAEMAESGEIDESRINDSARRMLELKDRHFLLDPVYKMDGDFYMEYVDSHVGGEENHAAEWDIMQKAVTILKDDGALPVKVGEGETVLVLYSGQSRAASAEFARQRLIDEGIIPESVGFTTMIYGADTAKECVAAAEQADHVIAVSTLFGIGEMDPSTDDGAHSGALDDIIAAVHKKGKKVVVISGYLPYDAARYTQADAIILSCGSAAMRTLPDGKQAYSVNIPAAICAAFGEFEPQGVLPVNIPKLDGDYGISDEILYQRGYSLK